MATQNRQFDFTIPTLIVGMGSTGLSCARYLEKKQARFSLADSREQPPQLEQVSKEFSQVDILTGEFTLLRFKDFQQFVVSPGVSIRSELFRSLQQQGSLVIGDIELFAQAVTKPVIAITGSNGKSTVTTLVEKIANDCGIKAIAGGNLGTPALDLLDSDCELYILELSSFQLETTYTLKTLSATVLNVSEDHMDRYDDLQDYRTVKESIYRNCDYAIINRDEQDNMLQPLTDKQVISFGSDKPLAGQYGMAIGDQGYVLYQGDQTLLAVDAIRLKGTFNYLNILAALALLQPLDLDRQQQLETVKQFQGLAHRCEWVAEISGAAFYNDSKGTNTGATLAAVHAFAAETDERRIILIAGGVGKDADFRQLGQVIAHKIKATVLLGVDSEQIKHDALQAGARQEDLHTVASMQDAVTMASHLARPGDIVLFSPACASFDMYQNYMERGEDFKAKVLTLKTEVERQGLQDVS